MTNHNENKTPELDAAALEAAAKMLSAKMFSENYWGDTSDESWREECSKGAQAVVDAYNSALTPESKLKLARELAGEQGMVAVNKRELMMYFTYAIEEVFEVSIKNSETKNIMNAACGNAVGMVKKDIKAMLTAVQGEE